jgi:3-oxoacyl-(acyl-carrier-protein) synthase
MPLVWLVKLQDKSRALDPCDYLERKDAKRIDRFAQFAVCASQQAIAMGWSWGKELGF